MFQNSIKVKHFSRETFKSWQNPAVVFFPNFEQQTQSHTQNRCQLQIIASENVLIVYELKQDKENKLPREYRAIEHFEMPFVCPDEKR